MPARIARRACRGCRPDRRRWSGLGSRLRGRRRAACRSSRTRSIASISSPSSSPRRCPIRRRARTSSGWPASRRRLRRIATLVAEGAHSQLIFDAVCEETGRLFAASTVNLVHFTTDGLHVAMSGWSERGVHVPAGTTLPLDGPTIDTIVRDSGAPGRCDSYEGVEGELAALIRRLGIKSEVGAPVTIDGEVWGALIAGTDRAGTARRRHRTPARRLCRADRYGRVERHHEERTARVTGPDRDRRRRAASARCPGPPRWGSAAARQRGDHAADGARARPAFRLASRRSSTKRCAMPRRRSTTCVSSLMESTRRCSRAAGLAAAVEGLADRAPVPVEGRDLRPAVRARDRVGGLLRLRRGADERCQVRAGVTSPDPCNCPRRRAHAHRRGRWRRWGAA